MPRSSFLEIAPYLNSDTKVISINDTESEMLEVMNLCKSDNILYLQMVDIESESSGFTEQMAKSVLEFVKSDDEHIVIHCLVGVSRSGAIAKFINEYFNPRPDHYLQMYTGHNCYVYSLLCYMSQFHKFS